MAVREWVQEQPTDQITAYSLAKAVGDYLDSKKAASTVGKLERNPMWVIRPDREVPVRDSMWLHEYGKGNYWNEKKMVWHGPAPRAAPTTTPLQVVLTPFFPLPRRN